MFFFSLLFHVFCSNLNEYKHQVSTIVDSCQNQFDDLKYTAKQKHKRFLLLYIILLCVVG